MSVAIAAVGLGAISAYSSNKNAKSSMKQQAAAMAQQNAAIERQNEIAAEQNKIAQKKLAMAQEEYDYYKKTYRPIEDEIVGNAGLNQSEREKMITTAGLTSQTAFESAEDARNRDLQRMGVNPNSGAYADSTHKSAIAKAVAKANSQNTARAQAEQIDYSQKSSALAMGKGIQSNVSNLMSSASSTLSGQAGIYANQASAYGQQASTYGAQANMYNQQASGAIQMGMGIAGAAMGSYGSYDASGAWKPDSNGEFNRAQFGKGLLGVW